MQYETQNQTNPYSSYAPDGPPKSPGPCDEAGSALQSAHTLHKQMDELENRLFGPEPRGIEGAVSLGDQALPPSLSATVRQTRQRLESAGDRLSRILQRL
jgi:hypothetical protein